MHRLAVVAPGDVVARAGVIGRVGGRKLRQVARRLVLLGRMAAMGAMAPMAACAMATPVDVAVAPGKAPPLVARFNRLPDAIVPRVRGPIAFASELVAFSPVVSEPGCGQPHCTETWAYRSKAWRRISVGGPPADPAGQMIRHGDRLVWVGTGGTWRFDGRRWRRAADAPLSFAVIASDGARVHVLDADGRMFALADGSWHHRGAGAPKNAVAMCHDPMRASFVIVSAAGTFEWTSQRFRRTEATYQPSAGSAMVYDPKAQAVLLFDASTAEILRWTGKRWLRSRARGPRSRGGASLVYDAQLQRVLLFGGASDDGCGGLCTDAWELWWSAQPIRSTQ